MSNKIKSRKETEEALLKRAAEDPDFRSELLENPRAAIAKAVGIQLPKDVKLTVVEESSKQMYLVLPPDVSGALSAADLDAVAGGVTTASTPTDSANKAETSAPGGNVMNPGNIAGKVGGGMP